MTAEKRLEVTDKSARIMATKIDKYVAKLNECKERLKISENPLQQKANMWDGMGEVMKI